MGLGCVSTHDACLSWLVSIWVLWYGSKTTRAKSKRLEPTHGLFADRDGGYVPPCGGSALRNDPSLHKVGQWLALTGWPLAIVIYLLPSDQLELVRVEGVSQVFGPFEGCRLTVLSLPPQVCGGGGMGGIGEKPGFIA